MESPLAGSDFVAVQPRRDIGLSPEARADLRALGVQIVSENLTTAYRWNPHLNKCAAMKWAERNVGTDFVTWLDGDMVFLRDPVPLVPRAGVSFMARAGEIDQGTDGSDVNAAYWDEVSRILGLDHRDAALIDSVPQPSRFMSIISPAFIPWRGKSAFRMFTMIFRQVDLRQYRLRILWDISPRSGLSCDGGASVERREGLLSVGNEL